MDMPQLEERIIAVEKVLARHSALLEIRRMVIGRLAWGMHPLVRDMLAKDLSHWEAQARAAELAEPNPDSVEVREIKHDAFLAEIAFIRNAIFGTPPNQEGGSEQF